MALIAQYKMNNSGNDSSGNNKNSVVGSGVSWDTLNSLIGSVSALFSGIAASRVNLPFGNGYNFTLQDLTISLWVKSTFTDNIKKIIISAGTGANSSFEVGQKDGYWFVELYKEWKQGNTPNITVGWNAVLFETDIFVAVGYGGSTYTNSAIYSNDGVNWNTAISFSRAENVVWDDICHGNGKFVAVGYGSASNYHFMYSTDGKNWTVTTGGIAKKDWRAVCYGTPGGNGRYVATGMYGSDTDNTKRAAYSDDGISWTLAVTVVPSNDTCWYGVDWGNGRYISVGRYTADRTKQAMYSTNGVDWTLLTTPNVATTWYDVCYGEPNGIGTWVAVGGHDTDETLQVMYSTDNGNTWNLTSSGIPIEDSTSWYDIIFANDMFVICSLSSSDSTQRLLHSYNGIDWFIETAPTINATYTGVAFGLNKFVAVSGYSSDYTKQAIYMTVDPVGNIPVSTNKTHIGIVFDSVNLEVRLYVDGILASTISFSTLALDTDFVVGANASAHYGFWEGLIDDIKIYDVVLSQGDLLRIKQLSASITKNNKLYSSELNEVNYIDKVFPNEKKQLIAAEFCEVENGVPYTGDTRITKTGKIYCSEFTEI